jgi:arginyl-tRNA synthetase
MDIKNKIENLIDKALKNLGIESLGINLEHPADLANGDYSTNVALSHFNKLTNNFGATSFFEDLKKNNVIINPRVLAEKIKEEIEELQDAEKQSNRIMALVELSDIVGAIQGYLERQHPSITMQDLIIMSLATRSAFMDGTRK